MLDRAIASALRAAADGDVEVVVVPNGPHSGWKSIRDKYQSDDRVKWFPVNQAHACVARNHGLDNAKGSYIRFLDDDDYLLPAAATQLHRLKTSNIDASIAPLIVYDQANDSESFQALPATDDFVCASLLSMDINNMTAGSIFSRNFIGSHRWREDVILYDDYIWLVTLSDDGDVDILREDFPVGMYVQHDSERLSRVKRTHKNSKMLVDAILCLHQRLVDAGNSTPHRSAATATALLTHAHSVFPVAPFFLSRVIVKARQLAEHARPLQPAFNKRSWAVRHLLLTEWLILMPRYLSRTYRRLSWGIKAAFTRT